MNWRSALSIFLSLVACPTHSAAAEAKWAADIVTNAVNMAQRLQTQSAQWETRITLPGNTAVYQVSVVRDAERTRFLGAIQTSDGKRVPVFRVVSASNIWYITEPDRSIRCRAWEHYFTYAVSELMLEAAELRLITDVSLLSTLVVEKTNGANLQLRYEANREESKRANGLAAQLRGVLPHTSPAKRANAERQVRFFENSAGGAPFSINRDHGFLVEWETQRHKIVITNFKWLPDVSTNRVPIPSAKFVDNTEPFRGANWEQCAIVAHDPSAVFSHKPVANFRLGIIRSDAGTISRIPLPTLGALGACFLRDRKLVVVVHQDVLGVSGLSIVNLSTGDVSPLELNLDGDLIGPPVLSPVSNTVALLYRPATAKGVLDFQMLV